jgi:hypothetical protein
MPGYEMTPIHTGPATVFIYTGGETSPDFFVDDIEGRFFVKTWERIADTPIYREMDYESENHWYKVVKSPTGSLIRYKTKPVDPKRNTKRVRV